MTGSNGECEAGCGAIYTARSRPPAELTTLRVGYAAGVFDLFHIGHLNILRQARRHCDYLITGVISDEMAESGKGRRPVVPHVERGEIVSHVDYVDEVHLEVVYDRLIHWRELGFDLFFKGDDWRGTAKGRDLERIFGGVGVTVVYFPYTVHTSSSLVREALGARRTAS